MFSARDEAGVPGGGQTRSVKSLLTATTRGTDAGMDEVPSETTTVSSTDCLGGIAALDVLMTTILVGCHVVIGGIAGQLATTIIVEDDDTNLSFIRVS